MQTAEDYRRFARECLAIAHGAVDEAVRATMIQMAQVWHRMAEGHTPGTDEKPAGNGSGDSARNEGAPPPPDLSPGERHDPAAGNTEDRPRR
jgi:hypothetical protein